MSVVSDFLGKLTDAGSLNYVKPTLITDPVAEKTEWKPLEPSGTNVRTGKIESEDVNRLVVAAAPQFQAFAYIFLVAALVPLLALVWLNFSFFPDLGLSIPVRIAITLFVVAISLVFLLVSCMQLASTKVAFRFDKSSGFYEAHRYPAILLLLDALGVPPAFRGGIRAHGNQIPLSDIHAIQIIPELVFPRDPKARQFYSFELNLVLEDGERVNVMDHGNREALESDAEQIARFLDVPIWVLEL